MNVRARLSEMIDSHGTAQAVELCRSLGHEVSPALAEAAELVSRVRLADQALGFPTIGLHPLVALRLLWAAPQLPGPVRWPVEGLAALWMHTVHRSIRNRQGASQPWPGPLHVRGTPRAWRASLRTGLEAVGHEVDPQLAGYLQVIAPDSFRRIRYGTSTRSHLSTVLLPLLLHDRSWLKGYQFRRPPQRHLFTREG